jgi:hypothetical protein
MTEWYLVVQTKNDSIGTIVTEYNSHVGICIDRTVLVWLNVTFMWLFECGKHIQIFLYRHMLRDVCMYTSVKQHEDYYYLRSNILI